MVTSLPMDQSDVPMNQENDAPAVQDTVPAESGGKLTFSGNDDDSVTEFIQAIQKHVFEQDRTSDDRWIVGYVGTCFTDSAMMWYSNLDEKTRNNWTRLRKALINRFGPKPQPANTPFIGQLPNMLRPGLYPSRMAPNIMREKAPNELRGRIEVFVPERNMWLGYLSYNYEATGTTFVVLGSKIGSALISFVPDVDGKPVQFRLEDHSNDIHHPYLGVAFDEPSVQVQPQNPLSQLQRAPGLQPWGLGGQVAPMYTPGMPINGLGPQLQLQQLIAAQTLGFQQASQNNTTSPSWTLKACTESNQDERYRRGSKTTNLWEKASAAVWKYDANTKELGVTWLSDDNSEEQLAVSVPMPTSYAGGHVRPTLHRNQDNAAQAASPGQVPLPQNSIPVKLFFAPED